MKCEICHKQDAVAVVKKIVNGRSRELFVCGNCAKTEQSACHGAPSAAAHSRIVNAQQKRDPMMLGLLLGEAFSVLGKTIHDQQLPPVNPSCPHCGITRNEMRARASFGCPECYKTFAREIRHWIAMDQYSTVHVGKAPVKYQFAAERVRLEKQLYDAIFAQRFEDAAQIRNKLNALPRSGSDGEKKT